MEDESKRFNFIIIGGGIAGVTCAETIAALDSDCNVLLVSASPLIKAVTNFRQISKTLESFDVEERPLCDLAATCPNVQVIQSTVTHFSSNEKIVKIASGEVYFYDKLCICTGGTPKVIAQGNPYVIGIRDTETVQVFQTRLKNARRIVVVGNGGIATEMVYEIEGCEVIWAIKDDAITSTFVDVGAATFLLPHLHANKPDKQGPLKRHKYMHESASQESTTGPRGSALGPDWTEGLPMQGGVKEKQRAVHVEYTVEVKRILTLDELRSKGLEPSQPPKSISEEIGDFPVYVEFTNGKIYGCDFIVSATGVIPNTEPFSKEAEFKVAADGGIEVNDKMWTGVPHVFAAGDVCTANWEVAKHWQQMRLWTQARQMGAYAAKCMVADAKGELDELLMDFCFELFTHVTKFLNFKVVLLGKFNAQGLGNDHNLLLRVTKGVEYVKAVMQDGRMQGAVLLGETELEETFENLILNQTDLSVYGEDLLDPNIDIEDYFD